jgi:hypothetical protein
MLADLVQNDPEGAAWMRRSVAKLSGVLEKNGLGRHEEPEALPPWEARSVGSFPYSFLHYLRRAYACVLEGAPMRTGELTDEDDEFIAEVTVSVMDSHLLSHSDCEGFYVPQSFDGPLCDDELPGSFAGSSQRLLAELVRVAPALGIRCEGDALAPGEEERLAEVEEESDPLWREKIVWFALYEAARFSVAHGTLIVFH